MLTKEQIWRASLLFSGTLILAMTLYFTYLYGAAILLICGPLFIFSFLVRKLLNQSAAISKERLDQTNRHVDELTHFIQEQERVGKILEKSEEQFRNAFDYAAVGMALVSTAGDILKVNRALTSLLGEIETNILGKSFAGFVTDEDVNLYHQNLAIVLSGESKYRQTEVRILGKDNRELCMIWNVSLVNDQLNKSAHFIFQLQDITDRKEAEEQLAHGALHDSLTNLPNRALFLDRLELAFKRARRHFDEHFAVLYLDFDRFKLVNDSYGHFVGDKLLIEIGNRLNSCLRSCDTVARLGGDEFTMLVEDVSNFEQVLRIVERIQEETAHPFVVDGKELSLSLSIGIAEWSKNYSKPEYILRDADTALYQAKRLGRNRYEIFDAEMHEKAQSLLRIETDLRSAVKNNEFFLNYQPILDLKTKSLSGFEGLVRWNHPDKGLVSPMDFIPIAEETGLIIEIGEWVLREACGQLMKWQLENDLKENVWMSVNVSPRQFAQSDFIEMIDGIIESTGISPDSLKLELTETAMIENIEYAQNVMKQLSDRGIMLSIDDFGTGYSSLSYIHQLPLSSLKIDRTFVNQMGSGKENLEIIKTIITLAKSLSLKIIAEGIETEGQKDELVKLACEFGQGYYFAKPLSKDEVVTIFSDKTAVFSDPAAGRETIAA
ncbi:MAG: EAL domain-containing protein [Pyrinomonadaceae bacterium]